MSPGHHGRSPAIEIKCNALEFFVFVVLSHFVRVSQRTSIDFLRNPSTNFFETNNTLQQFSLFTATPLKKFLDWSANVYGKRTGAARRNPTHVLISISDLTTKAWMNFSFIAFFLWRQRPDLHNTMDARFCFLNNSTNHSRHQSLTRGWMDIMSWCTSLLERAKIKHKTMNLLHNNASGRFACFLITDNGQFNKSAPPALLKAGDFFSWKRQLTFKTIFFDTKIGSDRCDSTGSLRTHLHDSSPLKIAKKQLTFLGRLLAFVKLKPICYCFLKINCRKMKMVVIECNSRGSCFSISILK